MSQHRYDIDSNLHFIFSGFIQHDRLGIVKYRGVPSVKHEIHTTTLLLLFRALRVNAISSCPFITSKRNPWRTGTDGTGSDIVIIDWISVPGRCLMTRQTESTDNRHRRKSVSLNTPRESYQWEADAPFMAHSWQIKSDPATFPRFPNARKT